MGQKRYHVQSTITEMANPRLCEWWRECDNRSAIVREALMVYLTQGDVLQRIGEQLDRVEEVLEILVKGLEHDDSIDN